jgi:hypothetical protein
MGSKSNPGSFDCYRNALPDEPMFVLLARDPLAPFLVERWADQREEDILLGRRPTSDTPMVAEARQCAKQMRKWRAENRASGDRPASWQSSPKSKSRKSRRLSTKQLRAVTTTLLLRRSKR